jgi:hypothetical protein
MIGTQCLSFRAGPGVSVRGTKVAAVLLLFMTLLAGCVEPEPEPEFVDPRPSLAVFAGCPWTYPDASGVDCDSDAARITAQESIPMAWLCVKQHQQHGWAIYWDPVTDTRGIWYESEAEPNGAYGTLWVRSAGKEHFFVWDNAAASGFLPLDIEFGETISFRYGLHEVGYAMNGTLAGATGRPVWSMYAAQAWAVHRFEIADGVYSFQNVTREDVRRDRQEGPGEEPAFHTFYYLDPFVVEGSDFTLFVHHERIHAATSQGAMDTTGINQACQLGFGA